MKNELVEKKENNLMANVTLLNNDLFNNDDKSRKMTTLDLNDEVQAEIFLKSETDELKKLNDHVGEVIDVAAVTIVERPFTEEFQNEETGEVGTRTYLKHTLILFTEDGEGYVTGSNSCYKSFALLSTCKHYMPTFDRHMKIEAIKVPAKQAGHSYLKIKAAK